MCSGSAEAELGQTMAHGEGQHPARFHKRADTRLIGLIKEMQRAKRPSSLPPQRLHRRTSGWLKWCSIHGCVVLWSPKALR